MGLQEFPEQGVFATCSPARPNPVLVSAVKLVAREGLILRVQGFEAVDGSPVVDIKPYNPGYFRIESPIIPEWMRRIRAEAAGE
jgi:tRNA (Thr-GGU) A37 N-methylase